MPIEKIDKSSAPIITKSVELANDSAIFLSDLSSGDKPWDKHRKNADRVASLYRGSEFQTYSDRVTCVILTLLCNSKIGKLSIDRCPKSRDFCQSPNDGETIAPDCFL
jgi:hypothetical protein